MIVNLKMDIRHYIYSQFDNCLDFLKMDDEALQISAELVEIAMINDEESNFYNYYGELINESGVIYNEICLIKNELKNISRL